MAIHLTVKGYADYALAADRDSYVVVGGTLPMLLSGKGDPLAAIDLAGSILINHLLKAGLDNATAYLDRRGASYTHTTAHTELDGFRYDPVNLDRYLPLWRRIWWRLRYW